MPFDLDKQAIERFVDPANNLYEALGLPMEAPFADIKERNEKLRTVTAAKYIHQVTERAKQVTEKLYNQQARGDYDRILRTAARGDLKKFLEAMVENDGILDSQEEQNFFAVGQKKGLPRTELELVLDDYCQAHQITRGAGGSAAPSAQRPAQQKAAQPQHAQSPIPPKPVPAQPRPRSLPVRRSEERLRWVVIATAASGIVGVSLCVLLGLGVSFRLIVISGALIYAIATLRKRQPGRAVIALVVAILAAAGQPLLLGVVIGIAAAGAGTLITHALGGRPVVAGMTSGIVFAVSVGIGLHAVGLRMPRSSPVANPGLAQEQRTPPGAMSTNQPRGAAPAKKPSTGASHTNDRATPPIRAEALFSSTPDQAAVLVDGKHIGVSPCACTLSAGKHDIKFVKEGYESAESSVMVDAAFMASSPEQRTTQVGMTPLFAKQIAGRWSGTFDDKPLQLSIEEVTPGGDIKGRGSIALASGSRDFRFRGKFEPKTGAIIFADSNAGLNFTGATVPVGGDSMSGTAQLEGMPLTRTWKASK